MRLIQLICLFVPGLLTFSSMAQDSLNMQVLFHWEDTSLVASNAHLNRYNEVWGYVKEGREYAIIGTTKGTHIFDVTNPSSAQQVALVPGVVQGTEIVHRDYHDFGGYLYMVCDEGQNKLQIADLSFLPDSAPLVYESDTLFSRSHNIFIDPGNSKLYVCGAPYNLMVFSLANPLAPQLLVNCSQDVPFWDNNIGYIHDIYVRNDTAYCNAGNAGLFIVDFTNTSNPQLVGSMDTYPQQGYNHSGWLHPTEPTYVLADENHGLDLKLIDVADFNNLQVLSTINSGINDSLSIPHNPIIHGDRLFVAYYHDGIYMYDIAQPSSPTVIGFYDTSTELNATNYRGAWGVYPFLPSGNLIVSDMQNGLYIFQVPGGTSTSTAESTDPTNDIQVYPNPFKDEIRVSMPQFDGQNLIFELYDVSGKLLMKVNLNGSNSIIPMSSITDAGLYLYRIYGNNLVVTGKLTGE